MGKQRYFYYKDMKYRILFKFIITLFILLLVLDFNIIKNNKKKIKICVCTVGKSENKYILEFVKHYKKYGIDKIYIYDNNDKITGERFENILSDYIKINFVEILNYRGIEGKQLDMLQDCYNHNYKLYDWLIFYDVDEFIYLKNYINMKDFLIQKKFNKCQSIYLNWIIHTDNNHLYYDNRPLSERFTEIIKNKNYCNGKTIIRGNIDNITIKTTHLLDLNIGRCNGFGKIFKSKGIFCIIPDYNYYYIDHYYSKSTEEFINKINKGDGVFGYNVTNKYERIYIYFLFNKISREKINLIANKSGLNVSIIKEIINKILIN